MALPEFRHIHCSSRYDRSPASLEADLDDWMDNSSLVTLTEITNDRRAAKLQEKGWGYYNARTGPDSDNCGTCWRLDTWKRTYGAVRRLSSGTFDRVNGMHNLYVYSETVVLRRTDTGHKLLVSVSHLPSHIMGPGGFSKADLGWAARKRATLTALGNWSSHVKDLERKQKTDATLIVADWNLNLKDNWVRALLRDKFGPNYRQAWKVMPTSGGVLHGNQDTPSDGPGMGRGDRIIDGTLYRGVKVTGGPTQMHRVRSSDHRPYSESFQFLGKAEAPDPDTDATGDVHHGTEWWGFGDYMDDELYPVEEVATGDAGGEVL
jgi:hypothetical protein